VQFGFESTEPVMTVLTIMYQITCLLAIPITNYVIDAKGIQATGLIAASLLLTSFWL